MPRIQSLRRLNLRAAAILLLAAASATSRADVAEANYDGLQRINVRGIDLAYVRPGATLAAYTQIMLDPVEVAFHRNWSPTRTGSRVRLSTTQLENIRTGVARVVFDEFVRQLQSDSNYQLVNAAGPDVLRVRARIIDLYANAPASGAGASQTFTVAAGQMTLFAELHDSETGELLARVVDRHLARQTTPGTLTLTNSVVNAEEVRSAAANWARILRDALDRAHAIGTP